MGGLDFQISKSFCSWYWDFLSCYIPFSFYLMLVIIMLTSSPPVGVGNLLDSMFLGMIFRVGFTIFYLFYNCCEGNLSWDLIISFLTGSAASQLVSLIFLSFIYIFVLTVCRQFLPIFIDRVIVLRHLFFFFDMAHMFF